MDAEPTVFRSGEGALLSEGIWWDARTDELVWVDIRRGTLHRARLDGSPDGTDDRVVELPAPLSVVQPAAGGGYVAALRDSVVLLDADGAIVRTLATIRHAHEGIRFNDGKVDPFGRFVVGSIDETTDASDARVYGFEADGRVRVLAGGFNCANGMDWSPGGESWFIADTSDETVYLAPYGRFGASGPLEPFFGGHLVDGLTLDADGSFWGAIYGAGIVQRWSLDGEALDTVPLPAPAVTSVGFGGPDLDILFVASARDGVDEEKLAESPRSGSIFRVDGMGRGRPVRTFGGG
ncbi:SMP-30/gluconolactonase/LRE family protein [Microbacterium sp. 4R-513]|uniref:SMP-30/gluconolactonase/LRE family protein n=1 Tax=Microbacterium sp. 4R-513 TaxID=2567934 RepID=UPI0013E1D2AF|nr:SMP-30/gluconolactonase/LRE family protein [Microbacterium sp. 4R-513]QIG39872.1 SMP-30/gluconolactonase/LRE family protein [Microbacterium sp. 4R-513]